ncbi:MAG: dihydropteroate synthase [Weeksellaceae bacterium]|nr:dihydropteroate synthase [Weeksellaceae bacterium]
MTINCKGELLDVSIPRVMGIINVNDDSFYAKSRKSSVDEILQTAEKMLKEGADILDVGGQSSRPGAERISANEELERVTPAIEALNAAFPKARISVDTFYAKVAESAADAGACIINDISAGSLDENMFETVAKLQLPYVLMHMQGTPSDMQKNPEYADVVQDVNFFFSQKLQVLRTLGLNDIILDPGFGFGKTVEHNYELLRGMPLLGFGEYPILAGISRKSMVNKVLGVSATKALNGTTALHMICLEKGANILRVHDVKEAVEAVKIYLAAKA